MKKTFKVVMLSINEKSDLFIDTIEKNKLLFDIGHKKSNITWKDVDYKHLFIISDDEIKEGDWVIGKNNEIISANQNPKDALSFFPCKKIIVTTDSSLTNGMTEGNVYYKSLPQLPESFIQAYIKAYNEGKPITEIDLEMDTQNFLDKKSNGLFMEEELINGIKTRPDNTVIVHQSKTYTKAEVKTLLYQFSTKVFSEDFKIEDVNKWIEENL